ncbi:MAG: alpha-glucosidase [Candidatus Marinimicrobia bacterium]|nr:alpha-glucosidase [Candidatus Neomarinimicrobiota bacterium]|tara:strand:- start:6930 stop:9071 length:2142 start_codon:yes stop_codon:yes gene_type:complete
MDKNKIIAAIIVIFIIALTFSENLSNNELSISSPNKTLKLNIYNENGLLSYSLDKNNKTIINPSLLGIETDQFKLISNLKISNIEKSSINQEWNQIWGEQKTIIDNHNEVKITLSSNDNNINMIVRFRLFNDGLGFRYEIPNSGEIKNYNIMDEITEFNFAQDSKSWWIPAYAYRRYEFLYANTLISEISRDKFSELVEYLHGDRIGPEAVQTPFTVQRDDGITIAIHEANLTNYSSMTLMADGTKNMKCDLIPWSDGIKVRVKNPLITPWRTIIVGDSPSELAMSTLTLNLNEPNKLKDTDWIKPGKYIGLWWEMIGTNQSTWGSGPNHGAKTDRVLEYIDFGSKYNFDGLLVEGWNTGWDENWCCTGEGESFGFYHPHPDFDHKKVSKYASEKGIRIVGHHETGTQIQNYESQMDSAFSYCQENGIRVVKTGYVNDGSQNIKRIDQDGNIHKEWHHGQYMVEHFRKVLETSAKYQVGIVVHEPIKDTGLRRTFPNMLSREGARGQEFNGFMPKDYNNKPNHTTIIPFTRLLSSPMDYTPGIFNLKDYRYHSPDNRTINTEHHIPSTIAKELALYVIIYAPVQMAADLPQNYEGHPAFQFILDVPVDWEKTHILNGEIGQYITTARKDINSDDWYLGSITNEDARDIEIKLSFLDPYKTYNATIYKDPSDGGWETKPEEIIIKELKGISYNQYYKIKLPKGGGQAIRFSPIN